MANKSIPSHSDWVFFRRQNIYRSNDELYLIRWELFRCPWFSIKLHKIILSDDACLHDHPWSFISLILWGGYFEWRPISDMDKTIDDIYDRFPGKFDLHKTWYKGTFKYGPSKERLARQWHGPLSILYRKVPARHCIEVGAKPAWTLVFCFPKVRSWGFHTSQGFVNWKDYDQNSMKCE